MRTVEDMTRLRLSWVAIIAAFAVATIAWASEAQTQCSNSLDGATLLNANRLFDAAATCGADKRPFETTLLMIEGQIRAMADIELLAPKTDQDHMLAANLYGKLFYVTGGAGYRELYRDPTKTTELFRRIDLWMPALPADYDPGWQYKKRPTQASYDDSIKYQKSYRVAQLRWYAALVRNDQYYAAEIELAEIQRRNPKGIVTGSSDGARAQELSRLMSSITAGIPQADLPKPRPFVFIPDPDADFKQVFVGFNGPERGGVTVLRSESDAAASWLASAVSPDELKKLLAEVRFDSQILVTFAVGERDSATGPVFVTAVSYNAMIDSFTVAGRVGVNEEYCRIERSKSYPFAVVIAKRPPQIPGGSGYDVGNFGDGCKQPKAGVPSASSSLTP
jgi:hypothetical protein